MRSSTLSTAAVLLSALGVVNGQTSTDCNPTNTSCPADPGYGGKLFTDFSRGESSDWTPLPGTTLSYDGGAAQFVVAAIGQAPVLESNKYIMFGRVEVWLKASGGAGVISSFILESDDLDEIDWEWFGSNNAEVETNFFGKGNTTTYDRATYPAMSAPHDSYHNYTIDWQPTATNFWVDGALVRTIGYQDKDTVYGINYPQSPMKVRMGNWIACPNAAAVTGSLAGTCSWAGPGYYDGGKYTMSVANVTIEDYGCGGDYVYSDMSGSWETITSSACSGVKGAYVGPGKGSVIVSGGSSSSSSSSGSSSATKSSSSSGSSSTGSASGSKTSSAASTTATTATTGKTSSTATTPSGTGSATGSKTSTSTSGPATQSTSAGNVVKPKHKYGFVDAAVMVLGLGIGYLVM